MAVGDLVGSSLFNLLILAVVDLMHQSRGRMLSRMSAAHALSGMASIVMTGLAAILILAGRRLPDLSIAGVGPGSVLIVVVYALAARLVYFDQRQSAKLPEGHGEAVLIPAGRLTLRKALFGFVGAAAVIVVAGPFLAESAGDLATLTGLGGTFIGSTLVALCTSLPELVASLAAVRMGAFDLAVGNVYGSNAFNMVLLLPLDIASPEPLLASVSTTHALTCLSTIVITSVALLGQLYHVERRIRLIEPDALLVILLVFAALWLVYLMR